MNRDRGNVIGIVLIVLVGLALIGLCIGPEEETSSPTADTTTAVVETTAAKGTESPERQEGKRGVELSKQEQRKLLKRIEVTVEAQDYYGDRQKYVIWVKNPTPYYFKGDIFVYAKDANGITVDREAFFMEKWLAPGLRTWGIAFFKEPWRIVSVTYSIEGEFRKSLP